MYFRISSEMDLFIVLLYSLRPWAGAASSVSKFCTSLLHGYVELFTMREFVTISPKAIRSTEEV